MNRSLASQPVFEADLAKPRAAAGSQRLVIELGTEIAGMHIRHHLSCISTQAQEAALWPHLMALGWQVLWVVVFVRFGARLFRRRVMKSGPQGAGRGGLIARFMGRGGKAPA